MPLILMGMVGEPLLMWIAILRLIQMQLPSFTTIKKNVSYIFLVIISFASIFSIDFDKQELIQVCFH